MIAGGGPREPGEEPEDPAGDPAAAGEPPQGPGEGDLAWEPAATPETPLVVAACRATLHFPEARSLKDKRQVLRGLVQKLRERHNASVLELDGRDLWQMTVLGVALAARDRVDAETRLSRVRRDIEEITRLKQVSFEAWFHG